MFLGKKLNFNWSSILYRVPSNFLISMTSKLLGAKSEEFRSNLILNYIYIYIYMIYMYLAELHTSLINYNSFVFFLIVTIWQRTRQRLITTFLTVLALPFNRRHRVLTNLVMRLNCESWILWLFSGHKHVCIVY